MDRYPTHSGMISLCIRSFKSMLIYCSVNFHFQLQFSASKGNDMSILGTSQRAPACIFLTRTIHPNDMACPKSSITPNHDYIYTYAIYKFVCMTAMNMKYLLCPSCTGCVQTYNDIQQVHAGYKREAHTFLISQSHGYNFKENQKCAYIF